MYRKSKGNVYRASTEKDYIKIDKYGVNSKVHYGGKKEHTCLELQRGQVNQRKKELNKSIEKDNGDP